MSDLPQKITSTTASMDGNQKKELPASVNVSESESIGSNLEQMNPNGDDKKSSRKTSLDDFVLPVKPVSSLVHKTEERRKKKKKEQPKEIPSLEDIKLLQVKRKEALAKAKSKERKLEAAGNTTAKSHSTSGSANYSRLNKPGAKNGDVGSLGDEIHGHLSNLRSQIGDIGNLGASIHRNETEKQEDAAWKRKLGDLGNLSEQPKNPETPSASDIGELSTFKKEISVAMKGLGPEATFMMKKSNVPKPHKLYWGVNAFDKDRVEKAPTLRRYWGINVSNKDKDSIPGENIFENINGSYLF